MKRKNLFLLLIMSILMIVPMNAKAFFVHVGGDCHVSSGTSSGTQYQLCYTGAEREITFITSEESPRQKYFCLQKDAYLDEAEYSTLLHTYTNEGPACGVYNALSSGAITIEALRTAMGGSNSGTINFDVTANGANYTVTSVTPGTAPDTYVKIQQAIWALGDNTSTATCTHPYVSTATAPKINSLSATVLTKDNESDEYYYSKVTINKNSAVTNYNVSVTGVANAIVSSNKTAAGQITGPVSASEFYVLIPATADLTATINVTASKTYTKESVTNVTLQEYKSNVERNQTLGKISATITSENETTSKQIKLVASQVVDFKICKKNSKTNAPMGGVTFEVKSADNSVSFELVTDSTTGCATRENVPKVVYTVKEKVTPAGFKKLAQREVDCTTTAAGTTCIYEAENTPISLKVKKLDESGARLVDAKMEIWYLDGTENGTLIDRWTTGITEDHVVNVETLQFGRYKLREQEAPAGYIIATEIEFEIREDSYVVGGETKAYGDDAVVTVTMVDEATRFSVLKIDADTGNPLAGAVLQIEDEDGNIVQGPWTTTDKAKVFTGMPFGTYYLVEVSAPEGYTPQEGRQQFTISATSQDAEIVIKNVPSTAAAKSALLISFAMLDIALGIAIILYVKKRQVTE